MTYDPNRHITEEIAAHLGATRMQLLPTDDAIISEHIIIAHELALMKLRLTTSLEDAA